MTSSGLPADNDLVLVHPSEIGAFDANRSLAALTRQRAREILGTNVPDPRELRRRRRGPCHICGNVVDLTYEHLPPRAAGNDRRRRSIDTLTAMSVAPGAFPSAGWVPHQRGAGFYATCAHCNNSVGHRYVAGYVDFAGLVASQVVDIVEHGEVRGSRWGGCQLTLSDISVGQVVRQGLFMLLVASGSKGLGERYPTLRQVAMGAAAALPADVRITLTLVANDRIRVVPAVAEVDLHNHVGRVVIEVAHFPLAWRLEIGPPSTSNVIDISSWTTLGVNVVAREITLESPIGAIATPFIGDYRHADEVDPV